MALQQSSASPHGQAVAVPPPLGPVQAGPTGPAALPLSRRARLLRLARAAGGLFPLTWVGVTILAVALASGWYIGIGRLDMVVLMVAFCALVALALMLLVVIVGFVVVHRVFKRPVGRTVNGLEAEAVSSTGWAVKLPWWLPFLDVAWTWDGGEGTCPATVSLHHEGRLTYEVVVPKRRGLFSRIIRKMHVRDILGLCCITWRYEESIPLRVLPHRGKVDQLVPLMGFVSGDDISDPYGDPWGDRVDMRQYSPGDSPRMIMWKVFARSRKLMVRVPERAVSARPRGCGYLIADVSKRPCDEAGAGVARVMLERHLLGEGWSFAADSGGAPATVVEDALDVLARSGTPTVAHSGFGDFLQKAEREGYGYCVLFVPPRPGPWLDGMLESVRRSNLRVHAFIGVDGLAADLARTRTKRTFFRKAVLQGDALDAPTVADLTEVVTKLTHCSGQVCLIDRAAGQLYANPLAILSRTGAPPT